MSDPASAPPAKSTFSAGAYTGILTILLTLAGWTAIPLFLRSFIHEIDGWSANGWRYLISALIWAPMLLFAWQRKTWPKDLWRLSLVPGVFNALGQVCFGLAPYYIKPGLMTFSLRIQIVFVTIGAAILFASERRVIRHPLFILGLAMVVGGTATMLLLNPDGLGEGRALGIALAIASGLFYAAYSLSVRKWLTGIHPLLAFAAVSQYTAAILFALMLAFGERHGMILADLSNHLLLMLVLSSVIGIGLGHTFYFISIQRLGLAVSAGVVQLQPITVSIASAIIFHEALTQLQWVTGSIAITGAVLMLAISHTIAQRALRESRARLGTL